MPEIDGWSVLRTLKADPSTEQIPVVMASILDERNRGFSLGASDYLSKPVDKDNLLKSIEKFVGQANGQLILVVEDDPDLQYLLQENLIKIRCFIELLKIHYKVVNLEIYIGFGTLIKNIIS